MKEIPKRLAPTTDTLRSLFAKSGNQCAFPECEHPLIDDDYNFIAQICHIEDAKSGDRFNESMTNEQRRSYDNLVLFCYPHHVKTNDTEKYPVAKLKEIKKQHEIQFTKTFEVGEATLINIFNDLKSIKDDATEILKVVKGHDEQFEQLKALITTQKQGDDEQKSDYLKEIDKILKLRDSNNQKAALQLLSEFKIAKWEKLNGREKYKVDANIGICYFELGDQKRGAEYLIDSSKHDPENSKALAFAALGYAIQGSVKEAEVYIKNAITKDPKNPNAYLALIALKRDDMEFYKLLELVPEELYQTQEIIYAIAELASHKNDYNTAIKWLQDGIELADKNKADLKAALATTIIESITNPFQILSGQIDNEIRNKVNYCIELFNDAWEDYKDTDFRQTKAWVLLNRGIAKKFIKKYEGAYADIQQAADISNNDYFTFKQLAIIAFETGKLDYSLELLEQIQEFKNITNENKIEIELFRANVYFKKSDFKQAISIFKNVVQNSNDQTLKDHARSTLIDAYLASDKINEAKRVSLSVVNERPKYLRGYIDASKVHAQIHEKEESISLINKACDQLTNESNQSDIQELAYQFMIHEDYPKAINALERITNPEIYTELSRTLLDAYYNGGEIGKALKLCQSVRSDHGPIDIITEMQSTIYESIGDLPKAIAVCEEYLEVYPDDQRIQIRLAFIYHRINDEEKVKGILQSLDFLGDLPIAILYRLAHLNITVGEIKKGLEIAFTARRKYGVNGDVHLKYIGLISEYNALAGFIVDPQKIKVDTVVGLKNEQGEIHNFYILDEEKRLSMEELLITDTFTKTLIGAVIGDVIEFDRNIGEAQKYEVVTISNKYVFAYQESIELLNSKFVGVKGFKVFNTTGAGNIKKDLKPIFESIDQSEKYDNQIYEYYHQKLLTIGACAWLKKQNPIRFWSHVFGNPELGIYSVSSMHAEFHVVHVLLENDKGIVIDLVSLLSLGSIKKLNLLEMIPNKMVVARSSYECINELISDLKGKSSEGFLSIGKVRGEYIKNTVSKEQIQSSRKHYEDLLVWIDDNCDVLPCNEALSMNAARKQQYNKTLGSSFIDSILIAKEHEYLLMADEETLRVLASSEFQVKGFPSYVLFTYMLKEKKIDQDSFDEEVSNMINLGYKYLPINSNILIKCADMAAYKPEFPFSLAIETMNYQISSEDSSLHVAAEFLYKIHITITLPQIRLNLILPVINVLVNGRNFFGVLQKLKLLIEIKFKLLQKQKDELFSIIEDYIKTNR